MLKWLVISASTVTGITLEAIIGALYACFGNINDKLSTIHDANLLDLIHVLSLNEIAILFTYTKRSSRTGHA